MNNRKKSLFTSVLLTVLFLTPGFFAAQSFPSEIDSPENLEQDALEIFVFALIDVQEVQTGMNMEIEQIMQTGDLAPDRLMEIHQIVSQTGVDDSIAQEELEAYEETISGIAVVEQNAQGEMIKILDGFGISVEHYNQIISFAQQDEVFMARLQEIISEITG